MKIDTRRVLLASLSTPTYNGSAFTLLAPTAMSSLLNTPRKQLFSEYGYPGKPDKHDLFQRTALSDGEDVGQAQKDYMLRFMRIDLSCCCCVLSAFEYDAKTHWLSAIASPTGPKADLVREALENYQEGQRLFGLRGLSWAEQFPDGKLLDHVNQIVTWDFLGLDSVSPLADFTVSQDFKNYQPVLHHTNKPFSVLQPV